MQFFTYILESESDGRYYFGQTQDLDRRLAYHNAGKSRYTRNYLPWKLISFKACETRSEALRFEKMLKNVHSRAGILDFATRHGFETP